MEPETQVQIVDEVVCISFCANAKCINLSVPPPAIIKTVLFNCDMTSSLGE